MTDKTEDRELIITRLSRASWFKLETGDKIIHFDPGYTGYFNNQGIPLEELKEKADFVFISHYHKDHLRQEALERIISKDTQIIATVNCKNRITADCVKGIKTVSGIMKVSSLSLIRQVTVIPAIAGAGIYIRICKKSFNSRSSKWFFTTVLQEIHITSQGKLTGAAPAE